MKTRKFTNYLDANNNRVHVGDILLDKDFRNDQEIVALEHVVESKYDFNYRGYDVHKGDPMIEPLARTGGFTGSLCYPIYEYGISDRYVVIGSADDFGTRIKHDKKRLFYYIDKKK